MPNTAYLILENGTIFEGKYFGMQGEVTGEIVFTTGMTGYLETLTDQSYYGQIILQTFPLIGNYGVIPADFEGDQIGASAYIVKYPCENPSNFRSQGTLDAFLKKQKIVGLYDIDTRALTKMIREYGVMNGKITADKPNNIDVEPIKRYKIQNAVSSVSVKQVTKYPADASKYVVALLDFGAKQNITRALVSRHCDVWVFPHDSTLSDILEVCPDGIMLSNGPGDPEDNLQVIENLKEMIQHPIPMFGICLGHQLLALANGFQTHKLKYGHRGANQPVKDLTEDRVYITSQNHGYAVVSESIDPAIAEQSFINLNDNTCEGITYKNAPVFSVQFHPEACAGPLDSDFLFDRFIENMKQYQKHR